MKLKAHDRQVVLGITGAGKSVWTARHVVSAHARVIVWDPHGEYADEHAVTRAVTLDQFETFPQRALDMPSLHVSVVARWDDEDELAEAFARWVTCCKTRVRDAVLVIEECALLTGKAQRRLAMLATQARHWECPVVMVAQRFVHICPSAREQMSRLTSFRQVSAEDMATLRQRIGDRAEEIAALPRWRCVEWTEGDAFGA